MTEDQWRAGRDPLAMLHLLSNSSGVRKWRLFAVEACRKALERFDYPQLAPALDYGATLADDFSTACVGDLDDVFDELGLGLDGASETLWRLVEAVVYSHRHRVLDVGTGRGVIEAIQEAYWAGVVGSKGDDDFAFQADLLREFFGNPFAAPWFKPRWRTSDVLQLARCIHEIRAFDRLPVLADALEEAGCGQADILGHCREPGDHRRGCWVLDLILEKPE